MRHDLCRMNAYLSTDHMAGEAARADAHRRSLQGPPPPHAAADPPGAFARCRIQAVAALSRRPPLQLRAARTPARRRQGRRRGRGPRRTPASRPSASRGAACAWSSCSSKRDPPRPVRAPRWLSQAPRSSRSLRRRSPSSRRRSSRRRRRAPVAEPGPKVKVAAAPGRASRGAPALRRRRPPRGRRRWRPPSPGSAARHAGRLSLKARSADRPRDRPNCGKADPFRRAVRAGFPTGSRRPSNRTI